MKNFTCKKIMNGDGGCDEVFGAESTMELMKQSSVHFMNSTYETHKPIRDMMASSPSKEEQEKWWSWFNREWERKSKLK